MAGWLKKHRFAARVNLPLLQQRAEGMQQVQIDIS